MCNAQQQARQAFECSIDSWRLTSCPLSVPYSDRTPSCKSLCIAQQRAEDLTTLIGTTHPPFAGCAQTAEMQKTLGELKEAIGTLEKGKAAAVEGPPDTVTLAQLRSELRVLATSLNEYVVPLPFHR